MQKEKGDNGQRKRQIRKERMLKIMIITFEIELVFKRKMFFNFGFEFFAFNFPKQN